MKNFLERFIRRLGFAYKKEIFDLQYQIRDNKEYTYGLLMDLQNKIEELEEVYANAAANNHKLKKLEEYLKVEYVSESPKPFIGYKKKK